MTTISDLTNEQLDKLIAEEKGWVHTHCEVCGGWHWWIDDDTFINDVRFSTDPRYAMELLKEMAEQHCFGGISFTKKWKLDYKACHNTYKSVFADTPERAIAEAWYQWKGEK